MLTPLGYALAYSLNYAGGFLLIHYGTPVISAANTVMVPVKTTTAGDFIVDARKGADGSPLWDLVA